MNCRSCGDPISGRYITDSENNAYCCNSCYRTILPKCAACGESMEQWTESENGKKFCSTECYNTILPRCKICNKSMDNWVVSEGIKYCSNECYMETWPKCVCCHKSIEQWVVGADGNKFCDDTCYNNYMPKCENCNSTIMTLIKGDNDAKFCSKLCREEANSKNNISVKPKRIEKEVALELIPIEIKEKINRKRIQYRYDVVNINSSYNNFVEGINNFLTSISNGLDGYEKTNSEIIYKSNNLLKGLNTQSDKILHLNDIENSIILRRKKIMETGLKYEALSIRKHIKLLTEKYASGNHQDQFENIINQTLNFIEQKVSKNNYLATHYDRNKLYVRMEEKWVENYQLFKSAKKEEFINICNTKEIPENLQIKFYDDWKKKRLIIESSLEPLLKKEFMITKTPYKTKVINRIINLLEEYKLAIDKFFVEERLYIHQRYAFDYVGDLKEKLDVEYELNKLNMVFQNQFMSVLFDIEDYNQKKFLVEWVYRLLDMQLDELIESMGNGIESAATTEIMNAMNQLKENRIREYILDAKTYGAELKNRDKDFNSLIFSMRSNLDQIK